MVIATSTEGAGRGAVSNPTTSNLQKQIPDNGNLPTASNSSMTAAVMVMEGGPTRQYEITIDLEDKFGEPNFNSGIMIVQILQDGFPIGIENQLAIGESLAFIRNSGTPENTTEIVPLWNSVPVCTATMFFLPKVENSVATRLYFRITNNDEPTIEGLQVLITFPDGTTKLTSEFELVGL